MRVICQYMGGGFGSKALSVGAEGLICAKLAKAAKAPVKLMLDRKEEHLATGNRPSAASQNQSRRLGRRHDHRVRGRAGARAARAPPPDFPLPYIYQFPNRRRTHKDVFINTGQQRPMRAPGHPQGSFNTEIMMDELADQVKMDPVEFRIKNLPPQAPNAMWRSYLHEGAAEFGWDKRHATGDKTPGPIKTGMGVSVNTWGGGGRGPARRTAKSRRMASSSCGSGRRISAPARARSSPSSRPKRSGCSPAQVRPEIGDTILRR